MAGTYQGISGRVKEGFVMLEGYATVSLPNGVVLANTTPHEVNVIAYGTDEVVLHIPAATKPLRLEERIEPAGVVGGIPFVNKRLNDSELPPVRKGVLYIVPLAVAQVARRTDFIVPDELVRDEQGRVVGCRRFAWIV